MADGRSTSIDVLKAFAALLIINSHLEPFHVRPWMAADGLLGNTIFFFTTGFTLAGSLRRNPSQTLSRFLWIRLLRLYPAFWLVIMLAPPMPLNLSTPKAWGMTLLYPTPFTFIEIVVPIYPFFFFLLRSKFASGLLGMIAGLGIGLGCAIGYLKLTASGGSGIDWSTLGNAAWMAHFGGAMLLGAWFALRGEVDTSLRQPSKIAVWCFAAYLGYAALRIMALSAMSERLGPTMQSLAILSMPMTVAVIVSLMLLLDSHASSSWLRGRLITAVVAFLAAHTWETYLLHEGIVQWKFVSSAPYPIGLILVFALTFLMAPLLRRVSTFPFQKARR